MSSRTLLAALACSSSSALQLGRVSHRSATALQATESPLEPVTTMESAPVSLETASEDVDEAPAMTFEPLPEVEVLPKRDVELKNEWYDKALPWQARPAMLECELAGDAGFDPAGFVNSKLELYTYREAEIKHARLAMLAAAGWPIAELWDGPIAQFLGLPSVIEENGGRDPSVLNGGLGLVSPVYWVAVVLFAGAVEAASELKKSQIKADDKTWMLTGSFVPGDLGFDPLGLYSTFGENSKGKMIMETAELKNGRLAMIAITVYAIQEFASGKAVVDLSPIFFTPFWKVVENLMFAAPPLYAQ